MKYTVHIDPAHPEEVLIFAKAQTPLVDAIIRLCDKNMTELIGRRENECQPLALAEICCFVSEDDKVFAITRDGKWQLKSRLYQLEQALPQDFIKINKSCIANQNMIARFDVSFSGTLLVKFKNGYSDYVSRRNLKQVKERLGLTK